MIDRAGDGSIGPIQYIQWATALREAQCSKPVEIAFGAEVQYTGKSRLRGKRLMLCSTDRYTCDPSGKFPMSELEISMRKDAREKPRVARSSPQCSATLAGRPRPAMPANGRLRSLRHVDGRLGLESRHSPLIETGEGSDRRCSA